MVSASDFRTSLCRHNVIDVHNVFANKNSGEMISHGRKAYPCNIMQTNQSQFRLCQFKSHVQTACESHDLNIDFCDFKQLCATNPMQEYKLYFPNKICISFSEDGFCQMQHCIRVFTAFRSH